MRASIVTKKGDCGKTFLYGGGPVSKNHICVETCGLVDELSSFLGLAKSTASDKNLKRLIESFQKDLFAIGAEIASAPCRQIKLKKRLGPSDVKRLENIIKAFEKKGIKCDDFCLPGKNLNSSALHVARSIARKLERATVTLKKRRLLSNGFVLVYLNRLSDSLFLMARACEN
jgi:ATP:cob(I)alamin adenosyltransferase